jgi:hypothetical protein
MQASDQMVAPRDGRGRFAPGQSGNPAGRRPGSRNHATLLRERLQDGDDALAVRVLMDRVRAGDGVAARFVADRLFPKPREREIDLGLPPPEDGTPVTAMLERALWLMACGELTIDEATRIGRLVADCTRAGAAAPMAGMTRSAPADDLQTAGRADAAAQPIMAPADAVRPANHPANRHDRRRAAALQRAVARTGPPAPGAAYPATPNRATASGVLGTG